MRDNTVESRLTCSDQVYVRRRTFFKAILLLLYLYRGSSDLYALYNSSSTTSNVSGPGRHFSSKRLAALRILDQPFTTYNRPHAFLLSFPCCEFCQWSRSCDKGGVGRHGRLFTVFTVDNNVVITVFTTVTNLKFSLVLFVPPFAQFCTERESMCSICTQHH